MKEMHDLKLAKEILKKKTLSLVIVKDSNSLFESNASGIDGLLQAIEDLGNNIIASSIADKVVGRAAALLIIYSDIKEVYTTFLGEEGFRLLKEHNILVEYENLVPTILDREGKNMCPFEKFAMTINLKEEVYDQLKAFKKSLGRKA
jgi:hypothetical protein